MNDFEKELNFDSDTFCDMKKDMNYILQRLLGNMIEKSSKEGSLTVKIDVILGKEQIPDYGPDMDGKYREISKPCFKHTIQSTVKINDKVNGVLNPGMELVMDEETGCYVLQPIANTTQRTMFDSDFMENQDQDDKGNNKIIEGSYIETDVRLVLPGPSEAEEPVEEEDLEDITDDILGDDEKDGYDYEDPEE